MNFNDRIGGILLLCAAAFYGFATASIPTDIWSDAELFDATTMPKAIAALATLIGLLLLVAKGEPVDWAAIRRLNWGPAALLVAAMTLYGLLMEFLGFVLASILFLCGGFVIMGQRRLLLLFAGSVPLVFCFWALLHQLDIYLDPGELYYLLVGTRE